MTAVEVRNGYKYYGSSSNPKLVLNYINMNVMRGSIYGLLGASGCGKTTLLSCVVGQRQLNSGDIRVLGLKPGLPGSGIPGPRIGYMPQEIALVEEMTVKETIYYFGRIYGLNDSKIYDRYKLLKDLLELPPAKRLVCNCSGGQQRRVSFACAMIHEPELLILDEPTVGLDPVLREKIWDFLVESTRTCKMAVIITTHYIEEAKQANYIGLMRNGILLAEDTPNNIQLKFESNSIEDAFLILSERQGKSEEAIQIVTHKEITSTSTFSSAEPIENSVLDNSVNNLENEIIKSPLKRNRSFQEKRPPGLKGRIQFTSKERMKALLTKNWVQLSRQPSGIVFMILFPILQLSCFYLAIGKQPTDIKVGIVTDEVNYNECFNPSLITVLYNNDNDTCAFNKLSCRYINGLHNNVGEMIFYNSTEDAEYEAKRTNTIGFLHFAHNFSDSLKTLFENGRFADESVIDSSQLVVRLDMTDQQIAYFLEKKLRISYQNFMESVMKDCNVPEGLGRSPVNFETPIYGSFDDEFQQYVAPGIIVTMVFFLATLMTAAVFISERFDGIWDRTLVAGISTTEMLFSHMISQTTIMILQSVEVIFYIAYVFDVQNRGEGYLLILLLILNGFCGMLYGLLISIYCKSHTMANFVATGTFYPMIILCGLLWPLEGMPKLMQDCVQIFPFTIPVTSARNILQKGWSITDPKVYNGFIVTICWIVGLFVFCIIGLRRRS